jgi:hypothetical protein
MLAGTQRFEDLINMRMDELDMWMLRLETSNNGIKIKNTLYRAIKKNVQDAFIYDYNMLIEEYDFYKYLPPKL